MWAYVCVHYAIRWLMHAVAVEADTDPRRLSFVSNGCERDLEPTPVGYVASVPANSAGFATPVPSGSHVGRRDVAPEVSPYALTDAHAKANGEILFEVLPASASSQPPGRQTQGEQLRRQTTRASGLAPSAHQDAEGCHSGVGGLSTRYWG